MEVPRTTPAKSMASSATAHELASVLLSALDASNFTDHWEKKPLVLHGVPLIANNLLTAADLPALSERLERRGDVPQIMRDGERCEPRELCWDFLDGGSVIQNKIDIAWPPIGRLCSALRSRFLHVFAVMYLTPRGSQTVPAHSDDQDVIILQLAGSKSWRVYGSPIELPYTHEQLGKKGPIDMQSLGKPLLQTELTPGSVLYMPRGFVHEARATEGGSSLHITLTVQTSDLCWRTFVRDGLIALHKASQEARLPLPLEPSLGGYDAHTHTGEVHEGVYHPSGSDRKDDSSSSERTSSAADLATGLMSATAKDASRAFELGLASLTKKLGVLNGAQDEACCLAEEEDGNDGVEIRAGGENSGALPQMLCVTPGIQMGVRALPPNPHGRNGSGGPPGGGGGGRPQVHRPAAHEGEEDPDGEQEVPSAVQLVCSRRDGSLTLTLHRKFGRALMFMVDTLKRGRAPFEPSELPGGLDAFEQVALCSRLFGLEALCDARAIGGE